METNTCPKNNLKSFLKNERFIELTPEDCLRITGGKISWGILIGIPVLVFCAPLIHSLFTVKESVRLQISQNKAKIYQQCDELFPTICNGHLAQRPLYEAGNQENVSKTLLIYKNEVLNKAEKQGQPYQGSGETRWQNLWNEMEATFGNNLKNYQKAPLSLELEAYSNFTKERKLKMLERKFIKEHFQGKMETGALAAALSVFGIGSIKFLGKAYPKKILTLGKTVFKYLRKGVFKKRFVSAENTDFLVEHEVFKNIS